MMSLTGLSNHLFLFSELKCCCFLQSHWFQRDRSHHCLGAYHSTPLGIALKSLEDCFYCAGLLNLTKQRVEIRVKKKKVWKLN